MDNNAPLLKELLKYHNKNKLILSMPGNKCGKGFLHDELGSIFKETLGSLDITEVDTLDNLHNPQGVIQEAEELLAKTYSSKRAYFLVNGSTSGNLAGIFSLFNEGDEVLVESSCHKSIYNGLILRKLKVVYINTCIDNDTGIILPPTNTEIDKALKLATNPKGIIITSPNYYGVVYNNVEYYYYLKSLGLKIFVDSAHGAHYISTNKLPKLLTDIADGIVVSAHKTLPSLTQGAYLLVNTNIDKFDFYVRLFMTTSPSYLIMASLDYGRYYLDSKGKILYEELIDRCNKWKGKIEELKKVRVLSSSMLNNKYIVDETRYTLILPENYSGDKLMNFLFEQNIQCEMSFYRGVVLIFGPSNFDEDFKKLYEALRDLNMDSLYEKNSSLRYNFPLEKVYEPYEIINMDSETVLIEDATDKIAADFITPYPPGIPVVLPGQILSKEVLFELKKHINTGNDIIGISQQKIRILK